MAAYVNLINRMDPTRFKILELNIRIKIISAKNMPKGKVLPSFFL